MVQLGIFVAVAAAVLAALRVATTVWQPERGRIRRRLAGEFAGNDASGPGPLYRDLGSLDAELKADEFGDGAAVAARPAGWQPWATEMLRQAGVPGTPRQWTTWGGGAAVALGAVATPFAGWLVGVATTAVAAAAVAAGLAVRRKARRERYQQQLVAAFELMGRVLRAGQSIPEAFRAAVDASEDPLAGEFGRCVHQIEHGIRPEVAYRDLAERSGVQELRLFVVAMAIQRQTGGNLAAVLDRLAGVVRTRHRLRQRIRALTAEGRLQSTTLIVLPFLTFGVMYYLNRPYAAALLSHTHLLAATAACMAAGVVWIRRITSFEG